MSACSEETLPLLKEATLYIWSYTVWIKNNFLTIYLNSIQHINNKSVFGKSIELLLNKLMHLFNVVERI